MKIEYYLHQIWLAIICILMFVSLVLPIGTLINAEGASAALTNFRLNYIEGGHSGAMWALGVLLILSLIAGVFELLLSGFRNFTIQKRVLVFMILLGVGYYLLFVLYVLLMKGDCHFVPHYSAAFPLVCMVLEYMTIHGITKAEADIIAKANGFRLRD